MPIRFLSRSLHGLLLHIPSGQASSWIKQTVTGSFQSVFRVIDMLPTAFSSLDQNDFQADLNCEFSHHVSFEILWLVVTQGCQTLN